MNYNTGHVSTFRPNTSAGTTGVIALTTSAAEVLDSPATEAPRYVLGSSRVCNYSGAAVIFTLYYVSDSDAGATAANTIIEIEIAADDYVQIGDIPLLSGYSLYAKATVNGSLNLILFYEEID